MKKDRLEAESRREAENAVMKLYAGFARSMVPPPHFDIISTALLRAKKRERARAIKEAAVTGWATAFIGWGVKAADAVQDDILALNTPRKKMGGK